MTYHLSPSWQTSAFGQFAVRKLKFPTLVIHDGFPAFFQLAKQNLIRQRLFDFGLNQPRHRTRAVQSVVALLGQPGAGGVGERECDVFIGELRAQFVDKFAYDYAARKEDEAAALTTGMQEMSEQFKQAGAELYVKA